MQPIRVNPPRPGGIDQSQTALDALPLHIPGDLHAQPARLLTAKEVARLLGVSTQCLAVWRCYRRHGLRYIKIGNLVRYYPGDVVEFVARRVEGQP